jgi:hypothetical protein
VEKITKNGNKKKQKGKNNSYGNSKKRSRNISENKKQKAKTKSMKDNIILTSLVVISIIAILYLWNPFNDSSTNGKAGIELGDPNDYVAILKSSINDGELHYYEYSDVKYYVHKNPWGQVRTRISSCEACSSTTFRLEKNGKNIGCNACLTQWDSDFYDNRYISPVKNDGCGCEYNPPPHVPNIIIDDYVLIEKMDIVDFKNL